MYNRSNLEKKYYSSIYSKTKRNHEENKRLISSRKLANAILNRYSTYENSSSLFQHRIEEIEILNLDDSDSINSSLKRFGFESASISSLENLRTNSYLKSLENDCVETILLKMQPIEESAEDKQNFDEKEVVLEKKKKTKLLQETCQSCKKCCMNKNILKNYLSLMKPIDFQSGYYLLWLFLVSSAYIYNLISVSIRYAFEYDKGYGPEFFSNITEIKEITNHSIEVNSTNYTYSALENFFYFEKKYLWHVGDYLSDLVYLIDIFLVQTRIKFIREGLWILDIKSTSIRYLKSKLFILDIISVVPFDIIQIFIGTYPLVRLNRWLKLNSLWEFFDRWDRSVQSYAFLVRLIRLFVYLQIVIHLYACTYFKISLWETRYYGINNEWVYNFKDSHIHNYVYSYLFGLKTASTIGNNPRPFTKIEYLFTAIAYVVALFLFALIVGQIRSIIGSLSTKQDAFLIVLDSTFRYIKGLNLPDFLIKKVVLWFDYWAQEQDEIPFEAISFLPINVQTDLAIEVYFELLSKVKLFQECEKNLLYALVLKLKPVTFMPGDYICKKGDVGREMFIVDKGIIEVVVDGKAVAQMKEGSYFGEISLLSMGDGGNRRTANVVSKGFSNLLVLKKNDLDEVVKSYPGMEEVLRKAAE